LRGRRLEQALTPDERRAMRTMDLTRDAIKQALHAKVVELAASLDMDASGVRDDDLLPATGLLDSNAILELVVWYESTYGLTLRQDEINIDNLGSIDAMADFLLMRKSGAA
jgi:acyl carrier protein